MRELVGGRNENLSSLSAPPSIPSPLPLPSLCSPRLSSPILSFPSSLLFVPLLLITPCSFPSLLLSYIFNMHSSVTRSDVSYNNKLPHLPPPSYSSIAPSSLSITALPSRVVSISSSLPPLSLPLSLSLSGPLPPSLPQSHPSLPRFLSALAAVSFRLVV